ncbi:hypothetical protein [Geoglobus acetivorans]|uniref:Phospholipase C/D domain-containing protein n=1 Tax=Geoglobus acetivorans TaxID=565033 RepID=A0A0A7GB42_GEOAI|nr:hypothetical protein GACE_0193 [Geoglobus acetivorans]
MKWADHRRITLEICRFYELPEPMEIAEMSVLPDREPDYYLYYGRKRIYRRRVPHHEAMAIETAFNYLKQARKNLISGMSIAEPLGRALHYLQDYSVDPTESIWIFKYRSDKAHEEREEVLKSIPIDFRAVEEAKNIICYPHEFKSIVYNTKRGRTPDEIMRACSFLTSLAIKLVLNPNKPENLKEKYNQALLIHLVAVILPWILATFNINFAAISAILSYVIHKLDFNYSKWRTNYEWFEVK